MIPVTTSVVSGGISKFMGSFRWIQAVSTNFTLLQVVLRRFLFFNNYVKRHILHIASIAIFSQWRFFKFLWKIIETEIHQSQGKFLWKFNSHLGFQPEVLKVLSLLEDR